MKKLIQIFKSLTAYDHFTVFLVILSILKIADVFADGGATAGLHFLKLGVALFVISSVLFFALKYLFDKKKKYQHALISTLLILLVLSHADPDPVRGVLVIVLVYVAKFFIQYKKRSLFNPIVFGIAIVTLLAMFIPGIDTPPADFSGINIRFSIMALAIPIALVPITLSGIFNVGRMKKFPLVLTFVGLSLGLGFLLGVQGSEPLLYILSIAFVGVAILTEPKTSPAKSGEQYVYGALMAVLITGFYYFEVPNAAIMGVFVGNLGYFGWRNFGRKVFVAKAG